MKYAIPAMLEASLMTGATLAVGGGYSASGPMLGGARKADYRVDP